MIPSEFAFMSSTSSDKGCSRGIEDEVVEEFAAAIAQADDRRELIVDGVIPGVEYSTGRNPIAPSRHGRVDIDDFRITRNGAGPLDVEISLGQITE